MNDETPLSDEQLISTALNYWANHIETGNIVLSANDACGRQRLRPLNSDQIALVARLRELATEQLGNESAEDHCRAARDGECFWEKCPQIRDGEPKRSGRSCPLRWLEDEEV